MHEPVCGNLGWEHNILLWGLMPFLAHDGFAIRSPTSFSVPGAMKKCMAHVRLLIFIAPPCGTVGWLGVGGVVGV